MTQPSDPLVLDVDVKEALEADRAYRRDAALAAALPGGAQRAAADRAAVAAARGRLAEARHARLRGAAAQLRALQRAKAALLERPAALTAVTNLLAKPFEQYAASGRLSDDDAKVVQLVLTLIRNLLAIPDPAPTAASHGDHLTRGREELLVRRGGARAAAFSRRLAALAP